MNLEEFQKNPLEFWRKLSPEQQTHLMKLSLSLWVKNTVDKVDNRLFSFENHPFLRAIYADDSKRRVVMKSTQLGLTTEEILRSFHKVCHGLNWIYWFPTSRLVSKFVQGRYNVLISNNPKLKAIIRETDGSTDNTTIKRIGQGVIYFSGLGAATKEGGQFETLSVPADGLTFDEVE